ncbi:MAG: DNA primase [Bacteroidetes bacterium]|nr:DNA primase [Bacteroidota bacterium]
MISQNTIQQILSRIDIVEIVGSFIKLKKRGTNYLGLCPFHNEKTPSFTVSPTKEIYKCFGCGRSGNTISFLMEAEKYSYVEALRWLAAKYNVEIEETETSPEVKQQQQVAESLYIINNFAQKFFTNFLLNTEDGRDIGLSYLKQRGFSEDIIRKFQIGFNPDAKDAFSNAAIHSKFSIDLLQKTGLITLRDGNPLDNYRGRIIFPIHNQSGKILGFGARIIKKNDRAPKYINTPENEIYVKSKILYGSYFARQAIDKADECLLVEGYTDVISLHQAGIENVVASGGTSLTPDQLRLIKKYTNNLTIIYDGDNAGIKAALRGLDLALEESLNVKLVLIPDKEDPDSYVNKVGPKSFSEFISTHKKDIILFQLEIALKDVGNDSTKKSEIVNQIAETISKINKAEDFTKQQDYIKQCSEMLQISESGLYSLVNKFIREKLNKEISRIENKNEIDIRKAEDIPPTTRNDWSNEAFSVLFQDELQEKAIAGILLKYGDRPWNTSKLVSQHIFDELTEDPNIFFDDFKNTVYDIFDNKQIANVFTTYKHWIDTGKVPSINDFTYSQDSDLVSLVIETTNHPYELSPRWFEDEQKSKIINRIQRLSYEDFMNEILDNPESGENVYYHEFDESYKNEVEIVLVYLKLKKIKRLILKNEDELKTSDKINELLLIKQTHLHLKEMQMTLGRSRGIVYYPF